jgi:hypothetical protein
MLSAEAISRWLPPDVDDQEKPHWDAARSKLTYKGQVIKRFKQPAKNQESVFAAFEEARWVTRIGDPVSPKGLPDPRQLSATVRQLNKNRKADVMWFEMGGDGKSVIWNSGPKPANKPAK